MNHKPKVLFVGPLPPPVHGIASVMQSLVNSSLSEHFDMEVLNIADRAPNASRTIGIFSIGNAIQGVLHSFRMLAKMVFFKPDCVFLFLSQGKWGFYRDSIFIRLAKAFSASIVANLGGSSFRDFYNSRPEKKQKWMKKILNHISVIQVLGHSLRCLFSGLVPDERITITPNGIDVNLYEQIINQRRNRKTGKNLLFLGLMMVGKGVVDLIKAFDLIGEEHDDAKLHLVGPWTGENDPLEIQTAIEDSNHKDRIIYHGTLLGDEKFEMYANADIFFLLTGYLNEGQPVAILEAMASGLPIITCDRGVVTDMVKDGKGGFVVPPRSPKETANRTLEIFKDPDLYRQFSEFNLGYVRSHFSDDAFVEKNRKDIEAALDNQA